MNKLLFKDYGSVVIRTPAFSYHPFFEDNGETKDLGRLIQNFLNNPVFLEGIYWASPQLYEAVLGYKKGNYPAHKKEKLLRTLKKYAIRACTRCTPYGTFAGTTVAGIGEKKNEEDGKPQRKVRIDRGLLQKIKEHIESDQYIWPYLRYLVNNSLHGIQSQYRFIESIRENDKCQYQISSIEKTALLDEILAKARCKPISVEEIGTLAGSGFEHEKILEFVNRLIKTQFLVSELQLGLTFKDDIEKFKNTLNRIAREGIIEARKYLQLFTYIEYALSQFERLSIGEPNFDEVRQLKLLLCECGIEDYGEHLFQADLISPIPSGFIFPEKLLPDIEKAITILGKLTDTASPQELILAKFKKLFYEKYETREVPLTEVLDAELGIGFPATKNIGDMAHSALIEDLPASIQAGQKMTTENCNAWLLNKMESSTFAELRKGIQLTEKELIEFDDKIKQLSGSFSVAGMMLSPENILIQNVGGAHASPLLGRFAYTESGMNGLCQKLVNTEQRSEEDVIFAEILYCPEGRTGNIARRPALYDYEIPILTSGSVENEKQILLGDLMVSVQQNEIVLRSKALNKRVIPRLSNAHNYAISRVPAYKFLASIQHQGKPGFNIYWGILAKEKRFLPRLSFGKIILHQACWYLYESDINTILNAAKPVNELKQFFEKWQVPRFICLSEGDNELFIDTASDSYLDILLDEIKSHYLVKLVEWLYEEVKGAPVIQQFILPLSKNHPVPIKPFNKPNISNSIQRTFEPGSEWLYFKIYCGAHTSDKLLSEVVKPVIYSLLENGTITKAFFIRYTDPHYHIRFRLHLINKEKLALAMNYIYDLLLPFCNADLVWKVQLDTYQREIERYGESSIETSEELFYHDSLSYLNCIEMEEFTSDEQTRFLCALKNLDKWLDLYDMALEDKINFCTEMSGTFEQEFNKQVKQKISSKYRDLRNAVLLFMNSDRFDSELNRRNKNLKKWNLPTENLPSYIHMSMNRWFLTRQRLMEYMAYYFCSRYYKQVAHQTNIHPNGYSLLLKV